MNWNLPILVFGITINIVLGLFVVLRNPKSATHVLFFLLSLDIAAWSVANYIAVSMTDVSSALDWTRIVMALAVPQAILFFFLISTIPSSQFLLSKKISSMSLPSEEIFMLGLADIF